VGVIAFSRFALRVKRVFNGCRLEPFVPQLGSFVVELSPASCVGAGETTTMQKF
jgi:hypothetical protein